MKSHHQTNRNSLSFRCICPCYQQGQGQGARPRTWARTALSRPRPRSKLTRPRPRPRTWKMSLRTAQGQGLTSLVKCVSYNVLCTVSRLVSAPHEPFSLPRILSQIDLPVLTCRWTSINQKCGHKTVCITHSTDKTENHRLMAIAKPEPEHCVTLHVLCMSAVSSAPLWASESGQLAM